MRHKDIWTYGYKGLTVEIVQHSEGEMINNGKGIWCYYIHIPERVCSEGVFDKLWLKDKFIKFIPAIPVRVTHDYSHLLSDCKWHGGVTYYAKQGHSVGHRCVVLGCDFDHLRDHERYNYYNFEEIKFEADRTAELVYKEVTSL